MSVLSPAIPGPAALRRGTGRAHGKVVLLGEHAVVHGAPAIALPVHELGVDAEAQETRGAGTLDSVLYRGPLDAAPERLQPTVAAVRSTLRHHDAADLRLSLRIRSAIPPARGLGSSAAVAAATIEAVLRMLGADADDEGARHELIQAAERVAHGTPSGLDARTVVSASPLWFQRGRVEPVDVGAPFAFVVADTGTPSSTREAVTAVHAQRAEKPQRVDRIVELLGDLATGARDDLDRGDLPGLGARMDDAHALLRQLTVSSPELDRLVQGARGAGALGAKLTGGGRGGCVVALATDADAAAELAARLRRSGATAAWVTTAEPPASRATAGSSPESIQSREGTA